MSQRYAIYENQFHNINNIYSNGSGCYYPQIGDYVVINKYRGGYNYMKTSYPNENKIDIMDIGGIKIINDHKPFEVMEIPEEGTMIIKIIPANFLFPEKRVVPVNDFILISRAIIRENIAMFPQ